LLRELIALAIRLPGLPRLIRNTYARNKVTIILYHDPRPEIFERHMAYLSKRYRFITFDNLLSAIESRDWHRIPPKALIVTFDDGHRGNYALLDIFKRYGLCPTIYLVTQVVGTLRHFWFCHPGVDCNPIIQLQTEIRSRILRDQYAFDPLNEYPADQRHALSRDEIEEMKDYVDFQPHTQFHPILPLTPDDESRREIADSKRDIESLLGRRCNHFSYPNGQYSSRDIEYVRQAGFLTARTIDVGWNDLRTDPLRLKITGVTDDASVNILAAQLSGITMYLRYLFRGNFSGRFVPAQRTTANHSR
jgi:peptidoglycan/xylan/chitin deacetylase (PgdA/CDA1 family)